MNPMYKAKRLDWLQFNPYSGDRGHADWRFNLPVAGIYLVLLVVGVAHHELWRDETQAWMIALHSHTLPALYERISSEAHPALWYLCLWGIGRLTANPVWMQVLHSVLAMGSVVLLLFYAPFSRAYRLLLPFGYFLFFEYALISRSYALGIFLLCAACALAGRRARPYVWIATLLALLANTSIFGWVLACALGLGLGLDYGLQYRAGTAPATGRGGIAGGAILIAGLGISFWQMARYFNADHLMAKGVGEAVRQPTTVFSDVLDIGKALLPVYRYGLEHFWGVHRLQDGGPFVINAGLLYVITLMALMALALFCVRRLPALIVLASAFAGLLAVRILTDFTYSPRHYGHYFLALLVTAWVYPWMQANGRHAFSRLRHSLSPAAKWLAVGVLGMHAVSGVAAYARDFTDPFSASSQVAAFIQADPRLRHIQWIFGSKDMYVSPVSALLQRPIYYVESQQSGGAIDWRRRPRLYPFEGICQALKHELPPDRPGLLIATRPYQPDNPRLRVSEIARFMDAIVKRERYYLYRLRWRGADLPACRTEEDAAARAAERQQLP